MAADIVGKEKSRWLIVTFCFFMVLLPLESAVRDLLSNKISEVQQHLKRLNKPPLKSIKSSDGDIIDCVPAAKQPAFDHPQLKNHVMQIRPSFEPKGNNKSGDAKNMQVWHETKERCPEGTVAIRRTKEEDVFRASSIQEFGRKKGRNIPASEGKNEFAVARLYGGEYYGTKAIVSIWKPDMQMQVEEFSLSQLWISAGSYQNNDLNTVEVGWQVYPNLYGDSRPRLFVFWTSDAYTSSGCYDLLCPGFVQTSNNVAVGGALSTVSVYGGAQSLLTLLVWRDRGSGNWWLKVGDENVGYWPSSLFTNLGDRATKVEWGGEVVNTQSGGHTTTDMGSGRFAGEGGGEASFFNNIQTVDRANTLRNVNAISDVLVSNANCYDLQSVTGAADGTVFYYGGPGRNPLCP